MASKLTKIKLVHNPKYQASGPKSYVYLLKKYKFGPTTDGPYFVTNKVHQQGKHGETKAVGGKAHVQQRVLLKRGATQGQAGEVPAEDEQNDSEYLCEVKIGTPGQNFKLDFDTGSADLWIWSTELPKSTSTAGHTVFDPKKSSTFKNSSGSTWKISYGDNSSASGTVGTDKVDIGGLVIKNQAIELANTLSEQFQQGVGDGLLGLAWGNINTVSPKPVATPVENMITQEDIPKKSELFTAHLGSVNDDGDADRKDSFYTFGYIDQDALGGQEPYYTPVDNSQGFWQFTSASATVAGETVDRSGNTAIADTGTTLALVDDATCEKIYKAIPGGKFDSTQQGYVFPTDTAADKLPIVSFAVGEKQFDVNKADLAFADAGNGMTYGGIQSRGDLTFDILGDTFLKGIYA
ncbi:MAG: hypothetical protein Q9191_002268, partial [Dirinaria sp. TL-2023a]